MDKPAIVLQIDGDLISIFPNGQIEIAGGFTGTLGIVINRIPQLIADAVIASKSVMCGDHPLGSNGDKCFECFVHNKGKEISNVE